MQMHKNPFYLTFIGILVLVVFVYSGIALYKYHRYYSLNAEAIATIKNWSVLPKVKEFAGWVYYENYQVKGDYSFESGNKTYEGSTIFNENYRNTWAAEQEIKKYEQQKWDVWYQLGNERHSTLQKYYPLKECVSAVVLWGLLLYFMWLGFYVTHYRT